MPTTLRVWTHWTDAPPLGAYKPLPPAPFPAALAAYPTTPGGVPKDAGTPSWSPTPSGPTGEPLVGWFALAEQSDLNAAHLAGSSFPGSPPPYFSGQTPPQGPDEGYSGIAIGFKVSKVTLLLYPNKPNNDYVFTIASPGGAFSTVVNPPWTGSKVIPVSLADGKGIWSILIERATGSSVLQPQMGRTPAGMAPVSIYDTYIDPYGTNEGYLGIEFEGDEITCPTETHQVIKGQCIEDPPGSGTLVIPVTLEVTFSAPPLANSQLLWTGLPAGVSSLDIINTSGTPQKTFSKTVNYPAGSSVQPTVTLIITNPTTVCTTVNFSTITLPGCLPCPNLSLEDPNNGVTGCAPANAKVEFKANISWPGLTGTPPQVIYTWTVHTPKGDFQKKTGPTNTLSVSTDTSGGWDDLSKPSGSPPVPVDLSTAGTNYSVAIIADVQCPGAAANSCLKAGCPTPITKNKPFAIPNCCPQVIGQLVGVEVSACEWAFSAQIDNPSGAQITWEWKFHDGTSQANTTGNNASSFAISTTHTYSFGSISTGNTELIIHSPNCPNIHLQTTVAHRCFGDLTPPTVSRCAVTAGTPGAIRVTFSEDVDKTSAETAANYQVKVNGVSQTVAAGSLTYDSSSQTTTITGINFAQGDSVSVTVSNVKDTAGNIIVANGATNTCTSTAPRTPKAGGCVCTALLIAAMLFLLFSAVAFIAYGCGGFTNTPSLVIAIVFLVISLILFAVWAYLCATVSECGLLNTLECLFRWLIAITPAVALIVGILGGFGCGIGVLMTEADWGLALLVVNEIQKWVPCPPTKSCFGISPAP